MLNTSEFETDRKTTAQAEQTYQTDRSSTYATITMFSEWSARATENARHEIATQSKKCNRKMQERTMRHNVAGVENAGNSAMESQKQFIVLLV